MYFKLEYESDKVHQIKFQLLQLPAVGFKRIEKYRAIFKRDKNADGII